MYHFFVQPEQIGEGNVRIVGTDVNHIKNVLRMKNGEEICVSDGHDNDYYCRIVMLEKDEVVAEIIGVEKSSARLGAEIYLFQGLPKSDKMELIIQKAVELGVTKIIPVDTKRCVVKLDEKKAEAKIKRWQSISESAAKQSGRNEIPEICPVMRFSEALKFVEDFDIKLIPYECSDKTMADTRSIISGIRNGMKVAVFIGPEGGFEATEVDKAQEYGVCPITLGKRILRTETAGLMVLSAMVYQLED
ncbi:MAG: 16S rRNA (uracil(1498)-N(3))-methyltransferase [Lachnospiraceae bacterium]|nr:16S rRNA (uracil(1498)-N(3))-methyltransferase [Lachnospiraceae bacterium]